MVSLTLYGKCSSCDKSFKKGDAVVMTGVIAGIGKIALGVNSGILDSSSQKVYCERCAKKAIN